MTTVLAPLGFTEYVKDLPRDSDLVLINDRVNDRIEGTNADANKPWRFIAAEDAALDGCCHDYALTKQGELLARGWPLSRLLLCEVKFGPTGYHMVLIAIDSHGAEWSLDNLQPLMLWSATHYELVRWQSTANPGLWES